MNLPLCCCFPSVLTSLLVTPAIYLLPACSRHRSLPPHPAGSMHALVASPFKSAYNAAKHGVAGLTKTVALEVRRVHECKT